jgi:hypothetical protein
VIAYENCAENLASFLSLLLLVLIPWGAVNLVDYYLVQHGNYNVPAMYVKSGQYWHNPSNWTYYGFNLKVLLAYFAGVVCGFPFVSCAWFKGPLADRLDGADLSWIPGLVVTTVVYLALVYRRRPIGATAGRSTTATTTHVHLEDRYEPCQPEDDSGRQKSVPPWSRTASRGAVRQTDSGLRCRRQNGIHRGCPRR